jgi:hypothetical protein
MVRTGSSMLPRIVAGTWNGPGVLAAVGDSSLWETADAELR